MSVSAFSSTTSTNRIVYTDANGNYTLARLEAASNYRLCFSPDDSTTGGSNDVRGYVAECWDNQPVGGTPTPVSVTLGTTTTGKNAALTGSGAVSGTVIDAGGTHHGLESVVVDVWSPSLEDGGTTSTNADGSYLVKNLPGGDRLPGVLLRRVLHGSSMT